jgi:hypothetical protein
MTILILSTLKEPFASLFSCGEAAKGGMRRLLALIRLPEYPEPFAAGPMSTIVAYVAFIMEGLRRFFDSD